MLNYLVIYAGMHLPSLSLKRWIFRCLGMRLGRDVTIASGVILDYFFPELIEIGDNTIIGMDAMLLTHEFLHDRFRCGRVRIGANCLVGARSTILAGVDHRRRLDHRRHVPGAQGDPRGDVRGRRADPALAARCRGRGRCRPSPDRWLAKTGARRPHRRGTRSGR